MRRLLVLVLAAGIIGFGGVPVHASSTQQISGMFKVFFPKAGQQNNVYPCPADVFCGVGSLHGLGAAEIDVFDNNFQPVPSTNCFSFDKQDDISLLWTESKLVLLGSGMVCFPGDSGNVPPTPSNQDYGHPSFWTSSLTVDGGDSTGIFAGTTGAVTEDFSVAGGVESGNWPEPSRGDYYFVQQGRLADVADARTTDSARFPAGASAELSLAGFRRSWRPRLPPRVKGPNLQNGATVLPNLLLRRDDQIGCPIFSPVDAAEAHLPPSRARRRRFDGAAGQPRQG